MDPSGTAKYPAHSAFKAESITTAAGAKKRREGGGLETAGSQVYCGFCLQYKQLGMRTDADV